MARARGVTSADGSFYLSRSKGRDVPLNHVFRNEIFDVGSNPAALTFSLTRQQRRTARICPFGKCSREWCPTRAMRLPKGHRCYQKRRDRI